MNETPESETPPTAPEFTPPSSQEELNKIIGDRLQRERAKFSDYTDLKAKAKRLDEIEEQSKTDLQKAVDAQQAAEKRASELEVQVLRASIAAQKGVLPELLTGTTEEEIIQAADRLIQWRGDATPKVPASTSSEVAGERGDEVTGAKQLTREDLKSMTSKQINQARMAGQLNTLMGVS